MDTSRVKVEESWYGFFQRIQRHIYQRVEHLRSNLSRYMNGKTCILLEVIPVRVRFPDCFSGNTCASNVYQPLPKKETQKKQESVMPIRPPFPTWPYAQKHIPLVFTPEGREITEYFVNGLAIGINEKYQAISLLLYERSSSVEDDVSLSSQEDLLPQLGQTCTVTLLGEKETAYLIARLQQNLYELRMMHRDLTSADFQKEYMGKFIGEDEKNTWENL